MDELLTDYIANLIATALLANGNKDINQKLRKEHEKVLNKFIKK